MCDNDRSHVIAMEYQAAGLASDAATEELNCAYDRRAREKLLSTPSMLLRPLVFRDGDQWCALFGEDLQCGVAGFGYSPEAAYKDFDRAWTEKEKKDV